MSRRNNALAVLLLVVLALMPVPVAGSSEGTDGCREWSKRAVASGLGSLENLEPDGTGGMLISASSRSAVERLTRDGARSVVAAGVPSPGGLRVRGDKLYVTTGNSAAAAALGQEGTVEEIDLPTGIRHTYSKGMVAPNGLVFSADGDAFTSRSVGHDAHISRIPADDPANPQTRWGALRDTNGLAVDPTNKWLYASTTFNADATVYRIRLDDPSQIEVVARLGGVTDPANGLDDMTIDRRGNLYIAANGAGRVIRLDPSTGTACVIASGLQNPTAVKFGRGPGWSSGHLFVSGFDGRVVELTPPPLTSRH